MPPSSPSGSDRGARSWHPALIVGAIALGYLAVLAAVLWRVWWQRRIAGWDCVLEYWPDLVFQLDSLGHGHLPLWNPHSLGGYSFAGDVQSGTFAPVNWLCWLAALVVGPTPWLIQLKVTVSLWLGLGGMHALVWSRTRSHLAAVCAALTYVLGSPLLVHKSGAFLWPLVYLPWAVLALAAFHARPSLRRGALLGLALWALGSAGHPQAFCYAGAILVAYWWFLTATAGPLVHAPRELARQGRGLVVALVVALALLAPTYLPALDAVDGSARATRTLAWVLGGGLPPDSLRELVTPDVDNHWQYDVYMGPLALVASLFALAVVRSRGERRDRGFWLAVAVVAVTLAMGRAGGVLPVLARYVPGFDLFRLPYRYKALLALPAALLLGDGVAAVQRGELPSWSRRVWLGLSAGFLGAALAIGWRPVAWLLAAATLGAVAAALFTARGSRRRTLWLALVPALVLAALWHAGRSKLAGLEPVPDPARGAALLDQMPGTDRAWRYRVGDITLPVGGAVPYHAAFVRELREFSGYSNPVALARAQELDVLAEQSPILLAHMNVRWFVGGKAPLGAIVRGDTGRGGQLREYLAPAPAVRLYPRAELLDADGVLARLRAVEPPALAAALVEPADRPPPLPASDFAPVDGRVVEFEHDRVTVEVEAPAAGILVSNEAWFPGWTAAVDGHPTSLFRANYLLRAVVVPAGSHRVVFRFRPRGYPWVVLGFVLGLLGALALLVVRHPALDRSSAARSTREPSPSQP